MKKTTLTHWGAFDLTVVDGEVTAVAGVAGDPDPSQLGQHLLRSNECRVLRPSVRSSWLESGPFAAPELRGQDRFVEVSWDQALDLAAQALERVRATSGNESIFGGSYGWASAGRFHHAPSQLKRFLNCIGGFVPSIGTYSHAAAEVVAPRVLGIDLPSFLRASTPITEVVEHSDVFVSFGGFPAHNTQISSGGDAHHWYRPELRRAAERGCRFISVSPNFGAFDAELGAEWLPIRPGTDAALLLGLSGEIVKRGLQSTSFLTQYCDGSEAFMDSLTGVSEAGVSETGVSDGLVKDAAWAAEICGLDEAVVAALAIDIATAATTVNSTWSTQRVENGEQAVWALIALGCVAGQMQTPGGGIAFGYGSVGSVGESPSTETLGFIPQGQNPVKVRIPVSRIADALMSPGTEYSFNGSTWTYPNIEVIYWSGGNPFHHHQDLNRLHQAWQNASAVFVNEPFWTATAQRADIVFPATIGMERTDFGGAWTGPHLVAMEQAVEPPGEAKDDHWIFAQLAERLNCGEGFTEGRSVEEWLDWFYETVRQDSPSLPAYEVFKSEGVVDRPPRSTPDRFAEFLADSEAHPLPTPSGRIELALKDHELLLGPGSAPHPAWTSPVEWCGSASEDEVHLISPMPKNRLHSQFSFVDDDDTMVLVHPKDAARFGLNHGDPVRIWNERGDCFGRADVTDQIRPGVVLMENGAWLPAPNSDSGDLPRHGNPNTLTSDRPTSVWGQATAAHSCLARIEPSGPA